MKVGEIHFWGTDQAKGYELRDKYHLYICPANWRTQGHSFLFINKSDYGGDYKILKTDYAFLTLTASYVGTSAIVSYTDQDLRQAKPRHVGNLKPKHLGELHNFIAQSELMEGWQIKLVCEHLRSFVGVR